MKMEHIKICGDQLKSCFEGKIQDQILMREGKSLLLPKPMYESKIHQKWAGRKRTVGRKKKNRTPQNLLNA